MSRNSSNDNGFQGGDRGAGQGGAGKGGVDRVAVQLMLDFQTTGREFEPLWDRIGPTMDGTVRGLLRKRRVKGAKGGVDENAVAESTQHPKIKLWELPGKGPKVWFRPSGREGARTACVAACPASAGTRWLPTARSGGSPGGGAR